MAQDLNWIQLHAAMARELAGQTVTKDDAVNFAHTFVEKHGIKLPSEKFAQNVGFGWYDRSNSDNMKRPKFARKADRGKHLILPESEWEVGPNARGESLPSRSIERSGSPSRRAAISSDTSSFPFDDRDEILRLARLYWTLIRADEAREERAFEQELPNARQRRFLTKPLFVRLARWKSVRQTPKYESNDEATIRELTARAFDATDERDAIEALTVLHGVALRTATAILHWMCPNVYPIIDFRVVGALGKPEPSSYEDINFYLAIAKEVRSLARRHGLDLRTIDRALWAWQKLQR